MSQNEYMYLYNMKKPEFWANFQTLVQIEL